MNTRNPIEQLDGEELEKLRQLVDKLDHNHLPSFEEMNALRSLIASDELKTLLERETHESAMGEGKVAVLSNSGGDPCDARSGWSCVDVHRADLQKDLWNVNSEKPSGYLDHFLAPGLGIPLGLAIFYFYRLWMVPIPIDDFERFAVPTEVRSGTEVTIRWNERRTRECRSLVSRTLIGSDGRIVSFEVLENPAKPVGRATGEFTFIMPSFQVSGPVTYRVKTEFKCNWVQELLSGPIFPLQDLHFNYTKE